MAPEPKAPIALSEAELEQLECLRPTLLPVVRRVLAAHAVEVERYRSGKAGLLGFFVAQVMKQVQPDAAQVNPKLVNAMLVRELGAG